MVSPLRPRTLSGFAAQCTVLPVKWDLEDKKGAFLACSTDFKKSAWGRVEAELEFLEGHGGVDQDGKKVTAPFLATIHLLNEYTRYL
jgi:hypothetical protein